MRILVTGASGFAGAQLIPRLLAEGHEVRGLARDPTRVQIPGIEVVTADVLTGEGLGLALEGADVAYYLIHSMERSPSREDVSPFPERERRSAENFAAAAGAAGVGRIAYLGGPTASWTPAGWSMGEHTRNDTHEHARETSDERTDSGAGAVAAALSPHLASREAVGRILREGVPDTVTLRASIVIGARSRSLRFLVRLVERMPVLALPAWRVCRTRPIDARDVTEMLAAAATVTAVAGQSLDVGGPEILSYGEMIERIAELMLLARPAVGLGVNATALAARVAAAIAAEDPELVGALMESLQTDLLPGGPDGDTHLRAAALLGVDLHSFDSSVECSLREWEAVEPLAAR